MLVKYEVKYFDSFGDKDTTDRGISYGDDLGDAVMRICNDYGAENVISVKIEPLEETASMTELQHEFKI